MDPDILLHLAIIILASKFLSALSAKLKQPPVIGTLLLGVVAGPSLLNVIRTGEVIEWVAQIGVLFLLFEAGLETDLKRIREEAKRAFLPAVGGVILPFAFGTMLAWTQNGNLFSSLVVGVIMTATSVSVSVVTLMDLGKMKGIEGRVIVNAAILDDILGILLLSLVFGLATGQATSGIAAEMALLLPVAKIIGFFIIVFIAGKFILGPLFRNLFRLDMEATAPALAVAFIFLFGWLAEHSDIAAITGAYFAGLIIGQTGYHKQVQQEIAVAGRLFFIDVFFVNIGLLINLGNLHSGIVYVLLFLTISMVAKMAGCFVGSRMTGFDTLRSLRVGIGMLPRGEVALIVANMAMRRNLIGDTDYSATILAVIVSAFITPILLKASYTQLRRKTF